MTTKPVSTLIFTALVIASGYLAPTAEAGTHATRLRKYTSSVAAATSATQAASDEWAKWPARRAAFMAKMRTHNRSSRVEVKRAEVRWVLATKALIDRAVQAHVKAIKALDAYAHFAGTAPAHKAARAQLKAALKDLRLHSSAMIDLVVQIRRMR